MPPCPFDFEQRGSPLNIDMFFLAGLDAVRETNPDYDFAIPEMLRFGILHDRTVYPVPLAETSSESSLVSDGDGDAPFFPEADPEAISEDPAAAQPAAAAQQPAAAAEVPSASC